jgi:hypothetical protein
MQKQKNLLHILSMHKAHFDFIQGWQMEMQPLQKQAQEQMLP